MTHPAKIDTANVWHGQQQAQRSDWVLHFTDEENAELARAAEGAIGNDLDNLTPALFPLPTLATRLAAVERELAVGRGFALLRGLPLADFNDGEIATIYCGIGAHLGVNVAQSLDGDRLGHVMDRGGTDRYYTRGGELEFHMDPVDVVGLLCLKGAVKGGASRIVSAMAIHNAVLEERPDLLKILYRGFHNSRRGHGETAWPHPVPTFAPGRLGIECYHLPITIRQAVEEGYPLTAEDQAALNLIAEVAARPEFYLDMNFQEGDIQFLNNRAILHARTDYVDDPDPTLKRHLLRLWLMMPNWPSRADAMNFYAEGDRAGGGIKVNNSDGPRP
jgi:hypothetical protein